MTYLLEKAIDLLVFFLIFVMACTTFIIQSNNNNNEPLVIETEFYPYFNQFKQDADAHKTIPRFSNLSTVFVNKLEGGVLAYCLPKFNTVKVSKERWNEMSSYDRKLLLYHEWGHCTLRREHVETYDSVPSGCPTSIMYPYMEPIIQCYKYNRQWYDFELFKNPNNRDIIP